MIQSELVDNFISRQNMYEEYEPLPIPRKRSRANGEGSIRKRNDKLFEGRVTIGFQDGKQIVKSVYAKTRKDCNDKMQKLLADVQAHKIELPSTVPVLSEWFTIWLREYRPNLGAPTRKRYVAWFSNLSEELRNKKITEVKPIELQQYINTFNSHEMARRCIGLLQTIFQDAKDNGYITQNPASALRNNIEQTPKRFAECKKSFTHEEENEFVKAIEGNPYEIIYSIILYAGLRRGEAVALRWNNIDLVNRKIAVVESAKRGETSGYSVGTTKTVNGVRTVPISTILFDKLSSIQNKSGFLCPNGHGEMLNADVVTMDFTELMKTLSLKHTLYHLRHTFATRCIVDKGINAKVVQAWMGHAKVDMTLNTYTHATEDLISEEIKKL